MTEDPFESLGEPWDVVRFALDSWRERFDEEIDSLRAALTEPAAEDRSAEEVASVRRLLDTAELGTQLLRAMRTQRFTPDLQAAVDAFERNPILQSGLDGSRLLLFASKGLVRRHIDAELIAHLVSMAETETERSFLRYQSLLVSAHAESRPAPLAELYLERASTLLLLNLDIECIVFCRAALEGALKSRIDDDEMTDAGFKRRRLSKHPLRYAEYDLSTRIEYATTIGLFNVEERARADRIRVDGNRAVHPDVKAMATEFHKLDARHTFVSLAVLLRRLVPFV